MLYAAMLTIYLWPGDDRNVHVHTWTGIYIQSLPLSRDSICAIQCSHYGTVLQLATVRDTGSVTDFGRYHLRAYKVSYISMTFCTTQHCPTIQVNFQMKSSKSYKTAYEMFWSYQQLVASMLSACRRGMLHFYNSTVTTHMHVFQVSLTFRCCFQGK